MAGGRRIPVTVEADTDGDFNEAARGLDKVAGEADKADGSLRRMSKGHQALDAEIKKTATSVKALRDEFKKTGDLSLLDDADKLDRNLQKLQTSFSKLTGEFGKKTLPALKAPTIDKSELFRVGQDAGQNISQGIMGTIQRLPPQAWMGIAAGAAVAGPVIGGVLSAGILSVVGGGVLAGGIALAVQDQRVSSAFSKLGKSAMEGLTSDSQVFIAPLLASARKFDDALGGSLAEVRKSFDALAPSISKITDGIIGFVDKAGPGLTTLVKASGPVLEQFAAILPGIGSAFTDMSNSIASSSGGAVAAVKLLGSTIEGTLRGLGFLLDTSATQLQVFDSILSGDFLGATAAAAGGATRFGDVIKDIVSWFGPAGQGASFLVDSLVALAPVLAQVDKGGSAAAGAHQVVANSMRLAGEAAERAKQGLTSYDVELQKLNQSLSQTAITADTVFAGAVSKVFSGLMALDQGTLSLAESQTRLGQTLQDNGHQLDIHTTKGQQNREAILGAVSANMGLFQANIASGMAASDATAQYQNNTRALEDQLRQAHFTQGEIDGLIGKYRNVPGDVRTLIAVDGLTSAIDRLTNMIGYLNGIDGFTANATVTTTYRSVYTTVGAVASSGSTGNRTIASAYRHGGIAHAQTGLITESPTVMFGERGTGKETYVPWKGISSQRAGELLGPTARNFGMDLVDPRRTSRSAPVDMGSYRGGGSPSGQTLTFDTSRLGRLEQTLATWLISALRTNDGGVQVAVKAAAA